MIVIIRLRPIHPFQVWSPPRLRTEPLVEDAGSQKAAPASRAKANGSFLPLVVTLTALAVTTAGAYYYVSSAVDQGVSREQQFQQAMSLMRPGKYPEAVARFDEVIRKSPEFPQAYLERGVALQVLGRPEAALANFDTALELDSRMAEAYAARAAVFRDRGESTRALAQFDLALKIQPSADAYGGRAQTYESLGEYGKAIADYDHAIELLPDFPFFYNARALAKRQSGDLAGYEADRALAAARMH